MKHHCPKCNRDFKCFADGDCGVDYDSMCSDCDELGQAFPFEYLTTAGGSQP